MAKTAKLIAVLGVLLLGAFALQSLGAYLPGVRYAEGVGSCKSLKGEPQIECVFRVIESEIKTHGITGAMDVFSKAYEDFPELASSGCHRHAHRVGDLAYYNLYLRVGDLSQLDFPQSTTACGYGFFHGFMEHLIQDNPRAAFVDETCQYLIGRLGKDMNDIETICYHGSGHGFVLAQIEKLPKEEWGNLSAFANAPADRCRELRLADTADIEQCIEGIYNVIADSASDKAYGFSIDQGHPFALCNGVPDWHAYGCYYEFAQKLDSPSKKDPIKLSALADREAPPQFRNMVFGVGIAGIVQQIIVQPGAYQALLDSCGLLSKDRYDLCLHSVVNGLFEHGDPQQEYKKALVACEHPTALTHASQNYCYESVAMRMNRFYIPERRLAICKSEFPAAYRESCSAIVSK